MKKQIFFANKEFLFFPELRLLFLKAAPISRQKILQRVKMLGNIKLAVLSGIFINNENSRVDLLLIGDNIKKTKLSRAILWLESEIGKELNYVVLTSEEFRYRIDMYDRFLRDILEFPHEKLINKLHI